MEVPRIGADAIWTSMVQQVLLNQSMKEITLLLSSITVLAWPNSLIASLKDKR